MDEAPHKRARLDLPAACMWSIDAEPSRLDAPAPVESAPSGAPGVAAPQQVPHAVTTMIPIARRAGWSEEDDALLAEIVERLGPKAWSNIAAGINSESTSGAGNRSGKECRERFRKLLAIPTEEGDRVCVRG